MRNYWNPATKGLSIAFFVSVLTISYLFLKPSFHHVFASEEHEQYENLQDRYTQLFEQMKDPATGTVPNDRLIRANEYTRQQQQAAMASRTTALFWEERGPVYDFVGPSNGNGRGSTNSSYTAGIVQTLLVDLANDPTGNTAFAGSPSGGLWKCTNLNTTSSTPNWVAINDFQANLAIASICQDPTTPTTLYIATGDANTRDVKGYGVWKSTDAGTTWSLLPNTTSFKTAFKIICDASHNLYLATGGSGLQRSLDGGTTWSRITPTNPTVSGTALSNPSYIPDIELSSTGRLHLSMGYYGTAAQHYYTDNPTTVDANSWTVSNGMATLTACSRIELATQGNICYAVLGNTSNNIDYCYKSTDGGANWTKQNTTAYTTGLGSGQSWYAVTLQIDPDNSNNFIVGGLDAYKSTNSGSTISRLTYWVTSDPYVHADHHSMQWYKVGTESRIAIGCDGGFFISTDAGTSWTNRNRNLGIKQFYSCSIDPSANYIIAGAQDNGVHQLKQSGLSWSTEVTGGDGAFVHINQQNSQIQYGSYVYNDYRRSTDGGTSWSSVTLSSSQGYFINPFDYDDANNIMYASNASYSAANGQIRRWANANTSSVSTTLTIAGLSGNNASAFKVSPYTANRVYVGGSAGKLIRLDNANGTPTETNITGASFPGGYINWITTGTTDNVLLAAFSNYGISNLWYSSDAGANWTAIDGNLPDMPVWTAVFDPGSDSRITIGTESGIYTTDAVNGGSTVWTASPNFPVVRVNMLKVRASDRTIVAATYGRGIWTSTLPNTTAAAIKFYNASVSKSETGTTTSGCSTYTDYTYNMIIANAPVGDATVTLNVQSGNATRYVDYDFTTNGNFTTPSNTLTFTNGAVNAKTFTVRVYDNGSVDGTRNFTLGYSISGTTNAQADVTNQTFAFTINDDDVTPYGTYTITNSIGTNNSSSTTVSPFQGSVGHVRVQHLIYASELFAAGMDASKNITALSLNIATKGSNAAYTGFTVNMGNTTATDLSTGFISPTFTTVYSGNYTVAGTGWQTITFSNPFTWDGISNIVINFCVDASAGGDDAVSISTAPLGSGTRASTYKASNAGNLTACTMAAQSISDARPIFRLLQTVTETTVESTLNNNKSLPLSGSSDQYFYSSSTGKLIARIKNLSTHDYGCTQVIVDRAGTTAQAFQVNTPSAYLMDKTFRVLPTTNNTSGQYQISLYFTASEKAGYETATGQSWNNVKIYKTQNAISSVTPSTPTAGGTIETATPTFSQVGTNYVLTATFNTGFSGFGVGAPSGTLPVSWLSFTGVLQNNHAQLQWTTAQEFNTKQFDIQRSYNGTDFTTIGNLPAAGNSFSFRTYTFNDPALAGKVQYYRLKQTDVDNRSTYSAMVVLRNQLAAIAVGPNPFSHYINITFTEPVIGPAQVTLTDGNGRMVMDQSKLVSNGIWTLPLTNKISAGVYILRLNANGQQSVFKLVRD